MTTPPKPPSEAELAAIRERAEGESYDVVVGRCEDSHGLCDEVRQLILDRSALLAALDERDAALHDLQLDGGVAEGRRQERAGILRDVEAGCFSGVPVERLPDEHRHTALGRVVALIRARGDAAEGTLPPDAARAEAARLRGKFREMQALLPPVEGVMTWVCNDVDVIRRTIRDALGE